MCYLHKKKAAMRYASEKLSALFWQSVKCAGTFRHQIWTARSRCLGLKLTSNKNTYLCKFINEDNFYSDFKDFSKINLLFVIPSCTRERLLIRPVVSIFLFRYPQISQQIVNERKREREKERKHVRLRITPCAFSWTRDEEPVERWLIRAWNATLRLAAVQFITRFGFTPTTTRRGGGSRAREGWKSPRHLADTHTQEARGPTKRNSLLI